MGYICAIMGSSLHLCSYLESYSKGIGLEIFAHAMTIKHPTDIKTIDYFFFKNDANHIYDDLLLNQSLKRLLIIYSSYIETFHI